ncbi:MAG TPA: hypothetical protein VFN25_14580 [Dokdonella sp.]|uniref:hypothetical protein n=1 Tax=Dokdonella sp. TaxID=2291710 RepID=UPI002D7F8F6B|nr:hypothetical protein [Dokdonella sp.]HET9034116.1 hypothetical protein [Dokdonella sp.]
MIKNAMELQLEIEVIGILEKVLALPEEERERWLAGQSLKANTEARVRSLINAASDTGEFLEIPVKLSMR